MFCITGLADPHGSGKRGLPIAEVGIITLAVVTRYLVLPRLLGAIALQKSAAAQPVGITLPNAYKDPEIIDVRTLQDAVPEMYSTDFCRLPRPFGTLKCTVEIFSTLIVVFVSPPSVIRTPSFPPRRHTQQPGQ